MKADLPHQLAREFDDRCVMARTQRDRYAHGTALWSYYDGQIAAYRSLFVAVRSGDFTPLLDKEVVR